MCIYQRFFNANNYISIIIILILLLVPIKGEAQIKLDIR